MPRADTPSSHGSVAAVDLAACFSLPFFFLPPNGPANTMGRGKSIRDGPWVGAKAKGGERSAGPRALKGVPPES